MVKTPPQDGETIGLRPGERPTLKTLSRLTGLAVTTVSRALNDAPDIGEATKHRVRAAAGAVGYRPDRAGVRLRTGKTNVISLVLSTEHDMMNHTARLISSIASGLHKTPFHMIVTPFFPTDDPMEPVRYITETRSADAIIINQTEPRDPRVSYLMDRNFPFVTHGRTDWADQHPYFDFDNEAFARIVVDTLAQRGRSHVLMVLPPMSQNYAILLRRGAETAAHRHGITTRLLTTATTDDPGQLIEDRIRDVLCDDPDIDGILTSTTTSCMSAAAAAEQLGRVIGGDIDLGSKEALPFLGRFRPSIIAVHEDVASAGRFIARAAMSRIADPKAPPMQAIDIPESDI